jgi:predicted ATPase/DNA-binding CsgD family transcriptional regulator
MSSFRHNLPVEVTSFVGREREMLELKQLARLARLLTLTGAGGCGKTRLAMRLATELLDDYPGGVWLVEFASLAAPALVPQAVASVLGIGEEPGRSLTQTLAAHLAARQVLLVLDNCEHLIEVCAALAAALLSGSAHLHLLATSREPLRVAGEVTWRVPSLTLPGASHPLSLVDLPDFEAVRLFLDRATARNPAFALTHTNAPAVAEICRRLDGLPLAIELAAALVAALSVEQIAAHLGEALGLLSLGNRTIPRQRTLRATLDWSYALLSEPEQVIFRRLAVLAGSFDLLAAEAICRGDGVEQAEVSVVLTELVERSLVMADVARSDTRYRLLETVRQYAWERLQASGEADRLGRRHAHFFLAVAEAAEPWLTSGERRPWLGHLAAAYENLRAALTWSQRAAEPSPAAQVSDAEIGLRLAGALCWFWNFRGTLSEGQRFLEAALLKGHGAAAVRAKALYAAGELAWLLGEQETARARLEESAALWRALGEQRGLAYTLQVLAVLADPHSPQAEQLALESLALFQETGDAWGAALAVQARGLASLQQGDGTLARGRLEEALARFRQLGDSWFVAQVLNGLGDVARSQGDHVQARTCYEESLALLRAEGAAGSVPSLQHNLGHVVLRQGDVRRAGQLFRESLGVFQHQGDRRGMAECLAGLAAVYLAAGQPVRAARLFGAAEALLAAADTVVWPVNRAEVERNVAHVQDQLDQETFTLAWSAGRAISPEQAVTEALAEEEAVGSSPASAPAQSEQAPWAVLTPREREVAALVAHGLTNRQIAERLVITEGTARLHVKHILHKLDCTSRAQIAVWAVTHGLSRASSAAKAPRVMRAGL